MKGMLAFLDAGRAGALTILTWVSLVCVAFALAPILSAARNGNLELLGSIETLNSLGFSPDDLV
jgi:hypothetical protein